MFLLPSRSFHSSEKWNYSSGGQHCKCGCDEQQGALGAEPHENTVHGEALQGREGLHKHIEETVGRTELDKRMGGGWEKLRKERSSE